MRTRTHTPISSAHVPDAHSDYIVKRRNRKPSEKQLAQPGLRSDSWKNRHPHLWPLLIVFPGSLLAGLVGTLSDPAPVGGVGGLMFAAVFFSGWTRFYKSFPKRSKARRATGFSLITCGVALVVFLFFLIANAVQLDNADPSGAGLATLGILSLFIPIALLGWFVYSRVKKLLAS
jgi:hypothetical protein